MVEIPVRADLDRYSVISAIDGTEYRLVFAYNTRDAHWYMSVELTDGTALATGIPIVADSPLLGRWIDDDLPEGLLMAIDSTGDGVEPVKDDLGDRIKLIHLALEDL